jgi:riboflavin kinase/FMN adenylyltransferase
MTEDRAARGRLVVIGNFDGVHLGHRAVVDHALREAAAKGLTPTVLTFDPHPSQVLTGHSPPLLTDITRKSALLSSLHPRLEVRVMPFTLELAGFSPERFAKDVLSAELDARVVVVGRGFRFGAARAGDLDVLRRLGEQLGFEARSEPLLGDEQGAFSSTRIRAALAAGDVAEAGRLLGRPHRLTGRVVVGDRRGRTLGFPTANLEHVAAMLPADGVYAGYAVLEEATAERPASRFPAVASLGARPTVDRPRSAEVHLLDGEFDLYGHELSLDLCHRLRGVVRFSSVDALAAQIAEDVEQARALLGEAGHAAPRGGAA